MKIKLPKKKTGKKEIKIKQDVDENITTDLTVFVTLNNVKATPKKKMS